MKKFNVLSIMLLLVFLTFTVLHATNGASNTHHNRKAVILLDDLTLTFKWDDEKKHPMDLQFLCVLVVFLPPMVALLGNISRNFDKKFIFLLPVFYQSNYVNSPPELIS